MTQIPKRIFYVWGANEDKKRDVNLCLLSWHQKMPDYEIIEINENSTEYFNFQEELKKNKYFRMVYDRKMYACVADYIRIKTLYDNGGIYFDTDVCALKTLDEFLDEPAFVGIEGTKETIGKDWVEPAILGAQKGNLFLKKIVEFYENDILKTPLFILPDIFMKFLREIYNVEEFPPKEKQEIIKLNDITIYPEKYFIPYRLNEKFSIDCIEPKTCTIHLWNGSWNNSDIRFFQEHKHKYPLWLLDRLIVLRHFLNWIFKINNQQRRNLKIKYIQILGLKFIISKKKI